MKIYFFGLARFLGVLASFLAFLFSLKNMPIHYPILSRLFFTAVLYSSLLVVVGTLITGRLPRFHSQKTSRYFLISVAAVTQIMLLVIVYNNNKYNSVNFSKELGENVRNGNPIIDLHKITKFSWDSMYLFGPYEPRSAICDTLNVQVKYCERVIPFESIDDSDMSIAFLLEGRLIRYIRHTRYNGDFVPLPKIQPVPASAAKFRVTITEGESDRKGWPKLVLDK